MILTSTDFFFFRGYMTPLEGFLYIMKHAKITQSGYSSPVLTPQWGRWELQGRWFGWPLGTAKCRGSEVGRLAEPQESFT